MIDWLMIDYWFIHNWSMIDWWLIDDWLDWLDCTTGLSYLTPGVQHWLLWPWYSGISRCSVHLNWYVITPEMFTKTEVSSKLKGHQNWNFSKTEMSPKLKCHQNWNVTKTEISPKLKCHYNWNNNKTEISSKLKCHQN